MFNLLDMWKKMDVPLVDDKGLFAGRKLWPFMLTIAFWLTVFGTNPGNKLLVISMSVWLVLFTVFLRNIYSGVFATFLLALPILVGKTYAMEIIPTGGLWAEYYPHGFFETIVIKPINLIAIVMVALIVREFISGKKSIKKIGYPLAIILSFVSLGVSSLVFSINRDTSFAIYIQLLQIPVLYFYCIIFFDRMKNVNEMILQIISAMVVALFFIAVLQFATGGTLGLNVEAFSNFIVSPDNFEENFVNFRPIATFYSAVGLSAFVTPFLPVLLTWGVIKKSRLKLLAFFLGCSTMILTLGRAAWVSFFVSMTMTLYFVERKTGNNMFALLAGKYKFLVVPLLITLMFSVRLISLRVVNSFYTFEESGGGSFRLEQTKDAVDIISRYPLFGLGLGNNVSYMFQNDQKGIVSSSPGQIHNGYLEYATEAGLLSLFFLLVFILANLRKMFSCSIQWLSIDSGNSVILFSMATGILGFLINAFFQPIFVQHRDHFMEVCILLICMGLFVEYDLGKKETK